VRTTFIALAASGCVTSLHPSAPATIADAAIAPGFTLPAQDGTSVALADALAKGPVVLVFYRGYW
jgi:cytochrome oxidase Cu insertion factor (SCO1/SenC/PrrC family)